MQARNRATGGACGHQFDSGGWPSVVRAIQMTPKKVLKGDVAVRGRTSRAGGGLAPIGVVSVAATGSDSPGAPLRRMYLQSRLSTAGGPPRRDGNVNILAEQE
jgi:hypothetical protein